MADTGVPRPKHAMSAAELKALLALERQSVPFLSWRDPASGWRFHTLDDVADGTTIALGRSPSMDIVVADERVSSLHAELRQVGEHWLLEDQDLSRNGTFVNGERILQRRLNDQDAVLVGDTLIHFRAPNVERRVPTTVRRITVERSDVKAREWRVLTALCRPRMLERSGAILTTRQLAAELHMSDTAVDKSLGTLFTLFGVTAGQGNKRRELIDEAVNSGLVSVAGYRD